MFARKIPIFTLMKKSSFIWIEEEVEALQMSVSGQDEEMRIEHEIGNYDERRRETMTVDQMNDKGRKTMRRRRVKVSYWRDGQEEEEKVLRWNLC